MRREKRNEFESGYSHPCAAITSCSTRGACSPAGCSHNLGYASWGQATICQIRPIGHVRCAVYSVLLSLVYAYVCVFVYIYVHYMPRNVSCIQHIRSPSIARIFVRRPEGYGILPCRLSRARARRKTRSDVAQIRKM